MTHGDDVVVQEQFCTFQLAGLMFGVPVRRVQEVLRFQEITPVPLAPNCVRGLLNLRGLIVVTIDLRQRLGMTECTSGQAPIIVVDSQDGPVGLLVDEIGDMVAVDESCFELPPETMHASGRDLIVGTYKLHEYLLLALDADRATDVSSETCSIAEPNFGLDGRPASPLSTIVTRRECASHKTIARQYSIN